MPSDQPAPRTLTQMLRDWDDESLGRLLRHRPELAFPAPAAFSELAARATTRHSVIAALDGLNALELTVARAASVLPTPFTVDGVLEWVGADPGSPGADAAVDAVHQLRSRALIWGDDDALRPVRVLVSAMEADETPAMSARTPKLTPPDLAGADRQRPALVDKAAAGSAFEFLRRIEVLVEHSDHRPVRLTQAGRLAVRDVRALGQLLDIPPAFAQAHLEFAHAAGFVGLASDGLDETVIPTEQFDQWRALELGDQWRHLVDAWLARHLGSGSAEMKSILLAAYGDPAEGRVPSAADLRSWLDWHRPRRPASWDRVIPGFVAQAATVGITGLGALASFALEPDAASLTALLPERVDHVLLQADLTAIAPGPLLPDVAADFAALADVESRGGATVFRFTRESLEQAVSLGWTPDDIVDALRRRSRTPVPQPLEYLVRDTARDRSSTVVAGTPAQSAVDDAGHRTRRRARPYDDEDDLTPGDRIDDPMVREIIAMLRDRETTEANAVDYGRYSESLGSAPLDTLREAVETQEVVWLGFVDRTGARHEQTARVTSVDDGLVRGGDAASDEPLAIPVSRILAAHIIRTAASR
jgi:hypothetical protein